LKRGKEGQRGATARTTQAPDERETKRERGKRLKPAHTLKKLHSAIIFSFPAPRLPCRRCCGPRGPRRTTRRARGRRRASSCCCCRRRRRPCCSSRCCLRRLPCVPSYHPRRRRAVRADHPRVHAVPIALRLPQALDVAAESRRGRIQGCHLACQSLSRHFALIDGPLQRRQPLPCSLALFKSRGKRASRSGDQRRAAALAWVGHDGDAQATSAASRARARERAVSGGG
jgi:hypothetical protein